MTSAPAGARCPATTAARRTTSSRCRSPVGTQVLHAVGIAMGAWVRGDDVVAMTQFGEGTSQPGRDPRGDELRRRPQAAGHLRVREQRLRDQRPARPAGGRRLGRGPRGRLRHARAWWSTAATCSPATRPPRRPTSARGAATGRRSSRRGWCASPVPLLRRRPAPLPRPRRGRGAQGARPDPACSPASCAPPAC